MAPANYTRDEERRVADAVRAGEAPVCPRCGTSMARRAVPPRREVAYVRDRLWLVCSSCRRSIVLDRPPREG